ARQRSDRAVIIARSDDFIADRISVYVSLVFSLKFLVNAAIWTPICPPLATLVARDRSASIGILKALDVVKVPEAFVVNVLKCEHVPRACLDSEPIPIYELSKGKYFNGSEVPPEERDEYPFTAEIKDQNDGSWRPVEGKSKRTINPNFQPPEHIKKFKIIQCQCLKNDDLFINAFPYSKFQIIIKNKNLIFGDKKQFFFKELLDDYISKKFFIINYGSTLIDTFLFIKEDKLVEKFCRQCHDITFSTEGLRPTSDIQLLSIIIEIFPQLSQWYPLYLTRFLSQTAFVVPLADPEMILDSEIIKLTSTPHLYHFGTYNNFKKKLL
ncbi:3461_t:CDS:2, partial [Dentiscutata heterogama]